MKKIIGLFALSVFLVGCAQSLWVKPTARPGEFESDRYTCVQQSQQRIGVATVNRFAGTAVDQQITNDQVFKSCMTAKGWSLNSKEAAEAQVAQSNAVFVSAKERISQVEAKIQASCVAPEYKEYYAKSACNTNDISFVQLADDTKITELQKIVLLKQQEMIATFLKDIDVALRSAGPNGVREADIRKNFQGPMTDKNTLNLYTGKITWGEYNQRRKEILREMQDVRKAN